MFLRIAFLFIAYVVYAQYSHLHKANTQKSVQQKEFRGSHLSSDLESSKNLKNDAVIPLKSQGDVSPSASVQHDFIEVAAWSPNLRFLFRLSPAQSPPVQI